MVRRNLHAIAQRGPGRSVSCGSLIRRTPPATSRSEPCEPRSAPKPHSRRRQPLGKAPSRSTSRAASTSVPTGRQVSPAHVLPDSMANHEPVPGGGHRPHQEIEPVPRCSPQSRCRFAAGLHFAFMKGIILRERVKGRRRCPDLLVQFGLSAPQCQDLLLGIPDGSNVCGSSGTRLPSNPSRTLLRSRAIGFDLYLLPVERHQVTA